MEDQQSPPYPDDEQRAPPDTVRVDTVPRPGCSLKVWTVHKSMGMTIGSNKLYGSSVAYVFEETMKSSPDIELISMSRSIQHSALHCPQGRGSQPDASRRSSYSLVINWNIEHSMTNQRSPEEELQLNSARVHVPTGGQERARGTPFLRCPPPERALTKILPPRGGNSSGSPTVLTQI